MGADPEEQATALAGELAGQVDPYVVRAQQLLVASHEATRRVAARVRETQERVQRTAGRAQQVADGAAEIQQATAAAVDRLVELKRREVAVHEAAVEVHEQAAEVQARLGHPELAAEARAHAEHARELGRLAAVELTDYQAQIAATNAKAGSGRHGERTDPA